MSNVRMDTRPRRPMRPVAQKTEALHPPYPEPEIKRLKGPAVVAVWLGLALLAWGAVGGSLYGIYRLAQMMMA